MTQESQHLGKAIRIDRSRTQYQEFCASTIPAGMNLQGFKIVIDCANGAGYKVAPRVLADLGRRNRAHRLLAERPQHQ